ncbi:MAG: hypothetical protein AB1467_07205 [Candidatus Diapherotrites archaeon]
MSSLEHLDLLLGEALESIMGASSEVKGLTMIDQKETLMLLGRIVCELWDIRDKIYFLKPELKRDFVREYEEDEQRYEKLKDLQMQAYEAENIGHIDYAISLYKELFEISRFGYFRLLAEAGLYRLSKMR